MSTKTTAKDFFMHIAVIVLLYAGTIALLNILFRAINVAFPQVNQYYGYYGPSISFPVATLIVVFPLFLFLANILQKGYAADPERKEYPVRKWLIYVTLFVAGAVLAGDLVTLIYYFLDGRELTTGFLLKVLSVLVVTGCIFGYYIDDLKERLSGSRRTIWRVVAAVLVIGSIVLGFSVIGSPQEQRARRYDSQRVQDLQSIQWQVVNYFQKKGSIPDNLSQLEDPISGFSIPRDPETGESYEYTLIGQSAKAFELCATFSEASLNSPNRPAPIYAPEISVRAPENWEHEAGRVCFSRSIDPQLYPTIDTVRE